MSVSNEKRDFIRMQARCRMQFRVADGEHFEVYDPPASQIPAFASKR